MRKIAIIGLKGLPAFGGAAAVGENIIEQLQDQYDFTVYSISSHTNLKTGYYNGYQQIVFKSIPLKKLNTLYYYILSAFHVIFFRKYNLIHLHHRDAAFIIPLLRLKYKVLLTIHGFGTSDLSDKWNKFKFYFKFQEHLFIRFASAITTMSNQEKTEINKHYNGNIKLIPNGVNLKGIEKYHKSTKSDYILFVAGRIVSFKRCDIFLKSLTWISYKGKIKIVGDIEHSQEYKRYLLNLSRNLDVEFLGLIKEKALLYELYSSSKLFIFPSYREAMSIVLLEAVSLKTPIIASNIYGNRQVFDENEILYFERDNVEDLANKILFAFNNSKEMLRLSENAYNKLEKKYTWANIAKLYNTCFNDLI